MRNDDRLYYYVEDAPSGWTLAIREEPRWSSPIDYPSKEAAVAAAIHLAQRDWESSGRPTGVRICVRAGAAREERTFGSVAETPAGAAQ